MPIGCTPITDRADEYAPMDDNPRTRALSISLTHTRDPTRPRAHHSTRETPVETVPTLRCEMHFEVQSDAAAAPCTSQSALLQPHAHPNQRCCSPTHVPISAAAAPRTSQSALLQPHAHPNQRCCSPTHIPISAAAAPRTSQSALLQPHAHPNQRCCSPTHIPISAAAAPRTSQSALLQPHAHPNQRYHSTTRNISLVSQLLLPPPLFAHCTFCIGRRSLP